MSLELIERLIHIDSSLYIVYKVFLSLKGDKKGKTECLYIDKEIERLTKTIERVGTNLFGVEKRKTETETERVDTLSLSLFDYKLQRERERERAKWRRGKRGWKERYR